MPPAELAKPERPEHFTPTPTGQLVTVDKGELDQLAQALKSALGMITELNLRIAGWSHWATCEKAELATGQKPAGC